MKLQKEVIIFENGKTHHIILSREIPRRLPKMTDIITAGMLFVFMLGAASLDSDSLLPILLVIASGAWLCFRGIAESVKMHDEEIDKS
jgi:hypothetical protein